MANALFGDQHKALVEWLTGNWWQNGPSIAAIQGFPGLGKTAIAEQVVEQITGRVGGIVTVHFDCPDSTATLVDDLVLTLAEQLNAKGDDGVVEDLTDGIDADGVFRKLLDRPRLIVLDEAQRLMGEANTTPKNKQIGRILENLSRATASPGRVLLLSSREFGDARWEERANINTLRPLESKHAQDYLRALLEKDNRTDAVPESRMADVASWLGGNPRAIHLLASALRRETLDYLIGLAPEAWEARDRDVSTQLLRAFETRVLTRAVSQLDEPTELFLRRLAVFRQPLHRKALEAVATTEIDMEAARNDLISRYIIELRQGHYHVHSIVRDTLLLQLAAQQKRAAHRMAGDYFARAFRAQQLVGKAEALGARFVEARYHFTKAESEKDLREIAERFENHLRNQFSFVSPVPSVPEELEERIVLLSALLKDRGPHALEYHLARCLLARGRNNDRRLALPHIRRATGPRAPAPAWVLRIEVEAALFGADEAIKAAREGIKTVPPSQNLFSLYQAAAAIFARDGKADEAVTLLREGIKTVPPTQNLSSLYQAAAEILARDGKPDEAVTLLREGIDRIGDGATAYKLAESAILICIDIGRTDQIDAFASSPQQRYLADVHLLMSQDNFAEAAERAKSGFEEFPRYAALLEDSIFAEVACGDIAQARALMEKWPGEKDIEKGSSVAWIFALTEVASGNVEEAKRYLDGYSGRTHADEEVTIETLVGYWIASCREFGSALSYHFPRIPTSISGLDHTLIRHHYFSDRVGVEGAVAPLKQAALNVETHQMQIPEKRTVSVLAIATEWSSGRGGLSTFNRQLCLALSQVGAKVACVVLEAAPEEIAMAGKLGVTLVEAPRGTGLSDEQRLINRPVDLEGFAPDLLIGHGRITGPAAASLQANHYQSARRVHFVHMAPDEIEPYKLGREDQAGKRAQDRTEIEEDLGRTATRVVAVGPRLHGRFATNLAGWDDTKPPLRFDPGFDVAKPQERNPPEGDPWQVLLLGRAEDVHLKGLDIAASAVAKAARERPAGLPRLELVIRGAKPDEMDQLRSDLEKEVGSDRLSIVVRAFTVSDEKLGADLRRASLVLMPSRAEGFGLVGVEAIVAGTPVLVSAESGLGQLLREQLQADQASRVVVGMDGNTQQLRDRWAGAIDRMLADREASFSRAAEIRELMAEKKTWRKEAEKLLAAITA